MDGELSGAFEMYLTEILHPIEINGGNTLRLHPGVFPGSASVSYFIKDLFLKAIEVQDFDRELGQSNLRLEDTWL